MWLDGYRLNLWTDADAKNCTSLRRFFVDTLLIGSEVWINAGSACLILIQNDDNWDPSAAWENYEDKS